MDALFDSLFPRDRPRAMFEDLSKKPAWIPVIQHWSRKIFQRHSAARFAALNMHRYSHIQVYHTGTYRQQKDIEHFKERLENELRITCASCGKPNDSKGYGRHFCSECKP